jgi:hypothetical protein
MQTRFGISFVTLLALVAGLAAGCPETPPAEERPPTGPGTDDIDGDGVPNDEDGDVDDDGIPNAVDLDIDGDRVPNELDNDIDGDGIANPDDNTDYGANPDGVDGPQADPDGDGLPNLTDPDDDNDGIPDGVAGIGSCDGSTPAADEGSDCDGFCVDIESGFTPCNDGTPDNPVNPGSGAPDNDGDGIVNPLDPDDDNDGIPDGEDNNDNGNDPCVGLEGPPPAICVDDPGEGEGEGEGPGPNCSVQTFDPADPVPPRILLVVDKSGSMNEDAPGFGNSKWFATVDAIDGVTHQLETRVEFGLVMYPEGGSEDEQCVAGAGLDEPVQLNNADEIVDSLTPFGGNESIAAGGTPTAVALVQARASLAALPADGGQRAIILATDGGPNCNESLNGNTCRCVAPDPQQCRDFSANCLDDVNTIAAANAVNQAGFPVFVLGIDGALNFQDVLRGVAQAGGTGNFFTVDSGDALATTIEDIADRVAACRFDLPGAANPDNVTVSVDGAPIARDTGRANGWDLIDVDTLELFGSACDAAAAAVQNVEVETCF